MNKIFFLLILTLCLVLSACSDGTLDDQTALSTPYKNTEDIDPDGKHIYTGEDTSLFPLYAMIKEENIYLYGIHDHGMILYRNGKGTYFDWPGLTPRAVLPQMVYDDFDGNGIKELAVTLYWGSGTGVAVMDLHVLEISENPDSWFAPMYTDYTLSASDVTEWMTEPITVTLPDDQKAFGVEVCGENYTVKIEEDCTFDKITYGDIVYFEFEGSKIKTKIAIAACYKEFVSPQFFGTIEAYVVFNGESFRLEDCTFSLD